MDDYGLSKGTNEMSTEWLFCVAGFVFSVSVPAETDIERLLPSFLPFRCETDKGDKLEKSEYAVTSNELKNQFDIPIQLFLSCIGYQ